MDLSTNNNKNFVELEENVLNEVNGGLPWRAIGKAALAGLGGGLGYGGCKKIFG